MPWEEQWGATDGRGNLKVRFPPTAFYMMQVGRAASQPWAAPTTHPALPDASPALDPAPMPLTSCWHGLPTCLQRDDQTRRQIEQATYILNRNGVPAEYVYVSVAAVAAAPLVLKNRSPLPTRCTPCSPLGHPPPPLPTWQVPARPVHRTWLAQRSVYINKQQSAQIWQALVKARVIDRRGNVLYDVRTVSGGRLAAAVWPPYPAPATCCQPRLPRVSPPLARPPSTAAESQVGQPAAEGRALAEAKRPFLQPRLR